MLHDYHTIIREPMDFSTLQSKLSAGDYKSADAFEYDMRLMFRNCYKYNGPGQPVNTMGRCLEKVFDEKWARMHDSGTADGSNIDLRIEVQTLQLEVQKLTKRNKLLNALIGTYIS